MNETENSEKEFYHNLSILIPLFLVLFLLSIGLLYCLHSGLFRRCLIWIGIRREKQDDLRDPLLEGSSICCTWPLKIKRVLLVKRCAQLSVYEIEDRIIDRLKRESRVKDWDRDKDDGQQPVIVFCVISSRIGTDIENAMRGVHGKSPVVLVLLHCVLSALLRGDLSDDEELLDPAMRDRMTGITHFAFTDREGLYACRQNTVGFEQLVDIVRSLD